MPRSQHIARVMKMDLRDTSHTMVVNSVVFLCLIDFVVILQWSRRYSSLIAHHSGSFVRTTGLLIHLASRQMGKCAWMCTWDPCASTSYSEVLLLETPGREGSLDKIATLATRTQKKKLTRDSQRPKWGGRIGNHDLWGTCNKKNLDYPGSIGTAGVFVWRDSYPELPSWISHVTVEVVLLHFFFWMGAFPCQWKLFPANFKSFPSLLFITLRVGYTGISKPQPNPALQKVFIWLLAGGGASPQQPAEWG